MDQVEHWANQDEVAPAIPVGVLVRFQTGSIFQALTRTCWKKNQSQLEIFCSNTYTKLIPTHTVSGGTKKGRGHSVNRFYFPERLSFYPALKPGLPAGLPLALLLQVKPQFLRVFFLPLPTQHPFYFFVLQNPTLSKIISYKSFVKVNDKPACWTYPSELYKIFVNFVLLILNCSKSVISAVC